MKFTLGKPKDNIVTLARALGYIPLKVFGEEFDLVRPLSGRGYPRFHLYVGKDKIKNELLFNLHLDQKKPSYKGSSAHSGEYEGELIENEAGRIKKIIENLRK